MSNAAPISPRILTAVSLPTGVKDLRSPPECLFLTGTLPPGPRIAIVGTRRPTLEAYRFTQELALKLALAGVAVVSGGAVGIDTAAHLGALRAGAGTLVVAPASYCCPYPEENGALFRRIVEQGGGYLSHFNEPTPARRHAFFARNALLASLCVAVILVQAPYRSGARNAVHWARELKRPYWVVPHPPWCSQGGSSVTELRLGGMPLSSADDVVKWLGNNHLAPIPLGAMHLPFERSAAEEWQQNPTGHRDARNPDEQEGDREQTERDASPRIVRSDVARDAVRPSAVADTQRDDVPGPHRDVCKLVAHLADGPRHPDELCALLDWQPAHLHATVLHATLLGEVRRTEAGLLTRCAQA